MDNLTLYDKLYRKSSEFAVNIVLLLEGLRSEYFIYEWNTDDLIWDLINIVIKNRDNIYIKGEYNGIRIYSSNKHKIYSSMKELSNSDYSFWEWNSVRYVRIVAIDNHNDEYMICWSSCVPENNMILINKIRRCCGNILSKYGLVVKYKWLGNDK